ncbi:coniferyl aldehyde dehydrogenase [Psychrobium sp. nBUS_13]|uniref:coniferyl aldehyde dehydrogenase n=1 Tax=Psychrobium sp. nBUS_13 TaxID=3395319 RepID=UPI003EB73050
MTATSQDVTPINSTIALQDILKTQKQAFVSAPMPSAQQRIDVLKQLKSALLEHQPALIDAMAQDYGKRPTNDSLIGDILPCVMNINYTIKRLKKWMKPSRRHAGLLLSPATVRVEYQPLGVIGIMVPWNFPVMLSISPLITALAAGNRAMLKLSEFTPHTNQAIIAMLTSVFSNDQVAVVEGEADVAAQFSALAFDHLIFTGSTTVGRHVMRAAAENLTPVTLELGGKSPAIVAPDIPIATAVERLIFGKCLNAGQICIAPDYVFCPRDKIDEFVTEYKKQFVAMYGNKEQREDYGNIINDTQHQRLLSWLDDAQTKGATITPVNDLVVDKASRNMATQLVTDTSDDMLLMQQEIFGPILPILPYDELTDVVNYIAKRPHPLALYIMSFDKSTQRYLLDNTHSGGVCINDTIMHVAADDAPFGGVGESGMGHYHGREGFLTFSKAKTVLSRGKLNTGKLVFPPYGTWIQKLMIKVFVR